MSLAKETITLIHAALTEDMAEEDLTSLATIALGQEGEAVITAKADGVISGVAIAREVFHISDTSIKQQWLITDGDLIKTGDTVGRLKGSLHALLSAERTAMNFLQHLSGIATTTRAYVDAIEGTGCLIADTRKTTPGLRHLEKQAVQHGGGINHRMDLASGMLIKENHIIASGGIANAIHDCYTFNLRTGHEVWIEAECETLEEVAEAVSVSPDIILVDNMSPEDVVRARTIVPKSILLEASGGITLENARSYAETGVDRIAIGAITHSAPALDLSMRIASTQKP